LNVSELSFREFVGLKYKIELPIYSFEEVLENHVDIAIKTVSLLKNPLNYFKEYLESGAYPIFKDAKFYNLKLKENINQNFYSDMPCITKIEKKTIDNLRKLYFIMAQTPSYIPHMDKLAKKVNIARPMLYELFKVLEDSNLIYCISKNQESNKTYTKPAKIYLRNTNILRLISENSNISNSDSETFFINMVKNTNHSVYMTPTENLLVDGNCLFNISSKGEMLKIVDENTKGYIVKDGIEIGDKKGIPLYLFGMMY
jgi:uncharacterized protein